MSDDEKEEAIYRVETVPPPAGETDAYNAPTKVGPMAAAVVEEMMHAAVRKSNELSQRADEKRAALVAQTNASAAPAPGEESAAPRPDVRPGATEKASAGPPASSKPRVEGSGYSFGPKAIVQDAPPPSAPSPSKPVSKPAGPHRVYDDDEEDDYAATMLNRSAKPPAVAPIEAAPPTAAADHEPLGAVPSAPVEPIASPFSAPLEATAARTGPVWLPVVVGFAIFFVGLALYLWAR